MKKLAIILIKFYQKTLSPDHSWTSRFFKHGVCRYTPTCSQYTLEAIEKYGLIKGAGMGSWRILRCNPWSKGGNDPVK
jgi:hypothetical protein